VKINKKVLGIAVFLMAVAMLATPVMAMGPTKALEVGNNPNLKPTHTGYGAVNDCGNSGNGIITVLESGVWIKWNWFSASAGKGKFKNAINAGPAPPEPSVPIFDIMEADIEAFLNGEETQLENKWIFMSPDGSGKQISSPIGTHGLVFWMFWGLAGGIGAMPDSAIFAAEEAAKSPDGVFWKYNFIKMD
jgi:hypothetical protein